MNNLAALLNVIVKTYLLQETYCTVFVSNNELNFNLNLLTLTIKSTPIDDGTNETYNAFDKAILNSLDLGCDSYIVYNSNIQDFLESYDLNVRITLQKSGIRKFIFIFDYTDIDLAIIEDVLRSKVLKYIPDFIIVYPEYMTSEYNSSFISDYLTSDVETYTIITREIDDPAAVLLDYWYSTNQSFLFNNNLFPYKVKNLHNMPLNLTTITTYLPYVMLDQGDVVVYPNKEPEKVADGIEIRVFREFCSRNNITLNISIEEDLWGDVFENRTGTAMFGSLLADKIDACCGSIGTWIKTLLYMEFSIPSVTTKIVVLVPIPGLKDKFDLVILPFTENLWAAVLFSTIILTIAFNYISRVTRIMNDTQSIDILQIESAKRNRICGESFYKKIQKVFDGFYESFYIMYGLTLLQPLPESAEYSNNAFRNLLTWILLQTLLISTAYSSGLSAIMTLPQYDKPIKSQQDLIDSKMEWGANDATWIQSVAISTQPKMIKLLTTYRTYTAEELIKRKTKFGYLIEQLIGGTFSIPEYASEEAILKSQVTIEEIYFEGIRAVFRKSSPFIPPYDKLVSQLQESGILFAFQKQVSLKYLKFSTQLHIQIQGKANSGDNDDPIVLSIYDLEGIFAIWCVGIVISCVCFGVEKYRECKQPKKLIEQ